MRCQIRTVLADTLEVVIRFLGRMPTWLTAIVALMTAAATVAIPQILPGQHGWHQALRISLGALFAALTVGLPLLRQWQLQQEARLKVDLEVATPDLALPVFTDQEKVIESLVATEEAACLASLPRNPPARPKRRGGFDAGAVAAELEGAKAGPGFTPKKADLSLRDYERLLDKKNSGAELTPEEEQAVADVDDAFRAAAPAISAAFGPAIASLKSFTRRDTRTVEEYREEVQRHLSEYSEFLYDHLQREYTTRGIGTLRLVLVNPTDRVFEDVLAEIYFPGKVRALNLKDVSRRAPTKPHRPRAFGKGTMLGLGLDSFSPQHIMIPSSANHVSRPAPIINNSGSATIKYPPVTLRPGARVQLDDIILVIEESPGPAIHGTWEATATNTRGRVKGDLKVRVSNTPLPVREMLLDVIS